VKLRELLSARRKLLIGVVHLAPLPGAPLFAGSMQAVLERASVDAAALAEGGADAIVVENFGDRPFHKDAVPAETIAAMARALDAVRAAAGGVFLGVNVLRNDARAALGLCAASGADFLRVNVHVGAAVTDQGVIEGRAAETLRERARLAPDALLFADVFVKHAAPLGAAGELDIGGAAQETRERGLADALIVTGRATGAEASLDELERVRERVPDAPLLLGSGVTEDNAAAMLARADGAIVGTWLKRDGDVDAPVDAARVARLRAAFDSV